MTPVDEDAPAELPDRATATARLAFLEEAREAARLAAAGLDLAAIARHTDTDPARVRRLLSLARYRDLDETSPEELILTAFVVGSPREELMQRLLGIRYTFAKPAPHPFDGALPGTWDQVRVAAIQGYVTREEYARLQARVAPGHRWTP